MTVSAKYVGPHVQLTERPHHPFPGGGWPIEVRTDYAPGEDMHNLALGLRGFLEVDPLG